MILRCNVCKAENPAVNRYCGQCGIRLEQSANDLPESWDDTARSRQFQPTGAAANLPPEVIDFDNSIPLMAEAGTDRRVSAPAELVEQTHNHLERESELHDEFQHRSASHYEMLAEQDAAREIPKRDEFLRWDSEAEVVQRTLEEETYEADRPRRTGVSGPSFLGLTDDRVPEYYEEPQPESHLRRNLALAIAAIATVLIGAQWNYIRSYSHAYLQNGSVRPQQHATPVPGTPPAVAGNREPTPPLTIPTSEAKPAAPIAVENSSNAARPLREQPNSAAPGPIRSASDAPRAPVKAEPPAMSAPSNELPRVVAKRKPLTVSRSAVKFRSPRTNSVRHVSPSPSAPSLGGAEMVRAANASDAEARAAWLWKAVSKGNPQAPVQLARMYERGTGVVQSCDQAQVLLRSAAAKGNQQARMDLQQLRIRGCSGR